MAIWHKHFDQVEEDNNVIAGLKGTLTEVRMRFRMRTEDHYRFTLTCDNSWCMQSLYKDNGNHGFGMSTTNHKHIFNFMNHVDSPLIFPGPG